MNVPPVAGISHQLKVISDQIDRLRANYQFAIESLKAEEIPLEQYLERHHALHSEWKAKHDELQSKWDKLNAQAISNQRGAREFHPHGDQFLWNGKDDLDEWDMRKLFDIP